MSGSGQGAAGEGGCKRHWREVLGTRQGKLIARVGDLELRCSHSGRVHTAVGRDLEEAAVAIIVVTQCIGEGAIARRVESNVAASLINGGADPDGSTNK